MKLNRIFIGVHVQFLLRFFSFFSRVVPERYKANLLRLFVSSLFNDVSQYAEYVATIETVISK
jgi:hypothetical protein